MKIEAFNKFCSSLPQTSHVIQWGGAHVWKVAGKVFTIAGWSEGEEPGFTFKVSEMVYEILRDHPGCRPAPYLASRGMTWIQRHQKAGFSDAKLKKHLAESHRLVALGLSKKKRRELGLYVEEL